VPAHCYCCCCLQDLKQEIKHTLQNKLHRNAGPEDLVAAEAMLQRILGEHTGLYGSLVLLAMRVLPGFPYRCHRWFMAGAWQWGRIMLAAHRYVWALSQVLPLQRYGMCPCNFARAGAIHAIPFLRCNLRQSPHTAIHCHVICECMHDSTASPGATLGISWGHGASHACPVLRTAYAVLQAGTTWVHLQTVKTAQLCCLLLVHAQLQSIASRALSSG
jgi:hypothetical protein